MLKLKHVPRTIPDNVLLDAMVALWRSGIQSSQRKGSDWQINLHGSPWTCKGELGFQARRLVVVLFQILGDSVSVRFGLNPMGVLFRPFLVV